MTVATANLQIASEFQRYESHYKKYSHVEKKVFFNCLNGVWYGLKWFGDTKVNQKGKKAIISPNTLWRRVCLIQTIRSLVNSFCVAKLSYNGKEQR